MVEMVTVKVSLLSSTPSLAMGMDRVPVVEPAETVKEVGAVPTSAPPSWDTENVNPPGEGAASCRVTVKAALAPSATAAVGSAME